MPTVAIAGPARVRGPMGGPARAGNPYQGGYAPSKVSITKEDLFKGLKGIKINAPNRKFSTQSYKSGLRKEGATAGNG